MKPIEFPEVNMTYGANQPEYLPLPCYRDHEYTISCWQLTWRERLYFLLGGPLWLRQLNFGSPLQPQLPTIELSLKLEKKVRKKLRHINSGFITIK